MPSSSPLAACHSFLAIHLHDLPLEVFGDAVDGAVPTAVGLRHRGVERVLRCNAAALAEGVRPGIGVGAARALCAGLRVLPRRVSLEHETLLRLAAWAIRFTPQVSLAPPRALLLEVAASLRLFGGPDALVHEVAQGLRELGHAGRLCLAPTPLGALVLARRGWRPDPKENSAEVPLVSDLAALRSALAALPLTAFGLSAREREDLSRMGLMRFAALLRLPRRGLRERLGPRRIDWLERLLGEAPDPRPWFEPPVEYSARIELPAELEIAESLVFPCRRLLLALEGFLVGRRAGVRGLRWRLVHADLPATVLEVGSAGPRWAADDWLGLLRGHFERLELPAPVREIDLQAGEIATIDLADPEISPALFPELAEPDRAPDPALLDRLRARLGRDAVRGIRLAGDHRPELAWRWCEPGERGEGIARVDRPLWLLPRPRPLEARDGRPWLDGPLDLGRERERIDTGWWDDRPVARDYFLATTAGGERVWIYRDLGGERGWYLHGVVG